MDDETPGTTPDESSSTPPKASGEATPADTAETRITPGGGADAGETRVAPPPDDEATRVMSGEAADATRVLPAAGGAPPPPPTRPQPTLMMSRPPSRESSNTWWIVLLVIVLALIAGAAVWYFLIRDTSTPAPAPAATFDWVGAWARTDGTGGGLVIEKTGATYRVTAYDPALSVLGVGSAAPQGKNLVFTLDTQQAVAGLPGPYKITLTSGPGTNAASMHITGANSTTLIIPLKRVPALVPVTPTPSPSPTATPTPTTSPTTSPSPSTSPTSNDQLVIQAIQKIQVGVVTWATNNNNLYPTPADVTASGGVAGYVNPWPTNPFTGQPMQPGTAPGDYTYEQLNGGAGYKLTGYIGNGLTYTRP